MKRHQVGDIFVNKITSLAYKKGKWLETTVILTNDRKFNIIIKITS